MCPEDDLKLVFEVAWALHFTGSLARKSYSASCLTLDETHFAFSLCPPFPHPTKPKHADQNQDWRLLRLSSWLD